MKFWLHAVLRYAHRQTDRQRYRLADRNTSRPYRVRGNDFGLFLISV